MEKAWSAYWAPRNRRFAFFGCVYRPALETDGNYSEVGGEEWVGVSI